MNATARFFSSLFPVLLLLLATGLGSAAQPTEPSWPRFRGENGAGTSPGKFPTFFSPETNLAWKVKVPTGHSSPAIWGERIFITGFTDAILSVTCLNRNVGSINWTYQVDPGQIEKGSHLSHPATATPATDGKVVVSYFGSFGLLCQTVKGELIWQKKLPVPVLQHGAGTSPVISGDNVILACDNDLDSYLLCLDLTNGEQLWRADRPGFKRGFSTPVLFPPRNPDQIIFSGSLRIVSYNLSDGSEKWSVSGLPNELVSSPVVSDSHVFVAGWTHGSGVKRMPQFESLLTNDKDGSGALARSEISGGPAKQHFAYLDANKDGQLTLAEYQATAALFDKSENAAMAIDPVGQGDVTNSKVLWRHQRGLPYCPSPLVYNGKLYLMKNGGLITCLDAISGKVFFQEERLGALGDYYASPVAADGKISVISQSGVAVVIRESEQLEILARNDLQEQVVATPAIVENHLYIRTADHLMSFGEGAQVHLSAK